MSQRGSLINHLAANHPHVFHMPTVGTGVTFYSWTDRSPGTIVAIVDEKKLIIEIKDDIAIRTDNYGMSESQSYSYETNYKWPSRYYKWNNRKAQWVGIQKNEKGRWVLNHDQTISVGHREKYHDYSF
jgi:hypothetical protein